MQFTGDNLKRLKDKCSFRSSTKFYRFYMHKMRTNKSSKYDKSFIYLQFRTLAI